MFNLKGEGESEKILKKALETRGFIGGDDEMLVMRNSPPEVSHNDGKYEEEMGLDEAMKDWKSYMEMFEFDIENKTPHQTREDLQNDIKELRIDIAKISNDIKENKISPADEQSRYNIFVQHLNNSTGLLQRIDDYLMTTKYTPWRNKE